MNIRKKKIGIIISIVILLLLVCPSIVQASMSGQIPKELVNRNGQEYPKNFSSSPQYFCIKHGFPVKLKKFDIDGNPSEALAYKKDNISTDIEPSVGYAQYCLQRLGLSQTTYKEEMQDIIWSSKQWGNPSNMLSEGSKGEGTTPEDFGRDFSYTVFSSGGGPSYSGGTFPLRTRSYMYGTVYYGILGGSYSSGSPLFTVTPANDVSNDELKIVVDQTTGQYTVGPYKLKINPKKTAPSVDMTLAKKILYAELTKNNNSEGYVNIGYNDKIKFAWFDIANSDFFSGLNGTDQHFVDQDGNQIEFPNFVDEKEFYIRFTPNDSGAIVTTGTPKVTIKYLYKFPGSFKKFTEGEFVRDHITVRITRSSTASVRFHSSTVSVDSWGGGNGWSSSSGTKYYQAHVYCDIVLTSSTKGGNSYTTEIKNLRLNMYRYQGHTSSRDNDGDGSADEWYFPSKTSIYDYNYVGGMTSFDINLQDVHVTTARGTTVSVSGPGCLATSGNITISPSSGPDTNKNVQDLICDLKLNSVGGANGLFDVSGCWGSASFVMAGKDINMQIGGHVFLDVNDVKDNKPNGRYTSSDKKYGGIEVKLYEAGSNNLIATTTTDNGGQYRFYGLKGGKPMINPLLKYYVTYTYNGQLYQQTYYKEGGKTAWSGGWSNAKELDREGFNKRFETLYSEPANYKHSGDWRKTFALDQKLEKSNHDYISYDGRSDNSGSGNYLDDYAASSQQNGALTFGDAWNHFIKIATYSGNAGLPEMESGSGGSNPKYTDGRLNWDRQKEYSSVYNELKSWLTGKGVDETEASRVVQFIKDCQITAETVQSYPVYDKFILGERSKDIEHAKNVTGGAQSVAGISCYYLYNSTTDQSRWVDFGINRRVNEDLALQKDVYKATVVVNGKKEEYIYNKKQLGTDTTEKTKNGEVINNPIWEIDLRSSDVLYNGDKSYSREIRRSEYLYDGSDSTGRSQDDAKNMQVFVTYRLAVKNMGSVDTKVRELVDYYDTTQYAYDGVLDSTGLDNKKSYNEYDNNGNVSKTYINSFMGSDHKGGRIYEEEAGYTATNGWQNDQLVVKSTGINNSDPSGRNKAKLTGANYDYTSLYLTGKSGALLVSHTNDDGSKSVDDTLHPGEILYVYLTFKVQNDTMYDRVKIDQDLNTAEYTLGKRNIAEINGFSSYYKSGDTIPDHLDGSDTPKNKAVGGKAAGLVDLNSNPGSLITRDLNDNGDIITDKTNRVNDRQQNDTDKAPNIRLIINKNGDDVRTVSGLVYEDARNTASNDAVVGDGVYVEGSGDKKINGVTLQLVELVQDVDADGMSRHTYNGEKVWVQHDYHLGNNLDTPDRSYQYEANNKWYYSGTGHPYIIINGDGPVLHVSEDDITSSAGEMTSMDGKYTFASMPAGDFYVRFMYGDTDKTALTNGSTTGAAEVNTLTGLSGLNEKSYNGQDYKSTTYQIGINQADVIVAKNGTTSPNFNGIELYKRTGDSVVTGDTDGNAQNYARTDYNHGAQIQFNYDEFGIANSNPNYYDNLDIDASTDVVYAGIPGKVNMYYYDIERADLNGKQISDAKDVWYYRDRSNEWSKGINYNVTDATKGMGYKQSLLNNRAEILRSFDYVTTYQGASEEERANIQRDMIKTLEQQTFGVSATGLINTEVERNTQVVGGNGDEYEYRSRSQITGGDGTESRTSADSNTGNRNTNVYALKNVDLGLVERPEAQVKINKEVSNFKIVLANNQVLFDASSSVKNLYFAKHEGHHVYNSVGDADKATSKDETPVAKKRLASVAVSSNSKTTPELLQTYIDDELTEGATMQVTYKYTLTNVGEVDYLDKQFYYNGMTNSTAQENISRTNTHTIVDYVTNMLKYDPNFQEEGSAWATWGVNEGEGTDAEGQTLNNGLTNSTTLVGGSKHTDTSSKNDIERQYAASKLDGDYTNRQYFTEISTYNTMLTTHRLSGELLPVRYDHGNSSIQTSLVLSTKLSSNNTGDNLIYNNLTEVIETTNTVGRRMQYSISGNQEMSDQSLGNNASSDVYTSLDLVTPTEIDADSAQKIVLMPPTGDDRNYLPIIISSIAAVAIIVIAVIVIKKKVIGNDKK